MVALNNAEAQLEAREAAEEERILGLLSGTVARHAGAILQVLAPSCAPFGMLQSLWRGVRLAGASWACCLAS